MLTSFFILLTLAVSYSEATWSVAIANTNTSEVSIVGVTCVTNIDLKGILPVVLVGVGIGVAQAAGDWDGTRRPVIRDGLRNGTSPAAIMQMLSTFSGHQSMQYGIVSLLTHPSGPPATFTGNNAADWAGGYTGQYQDYIYAVQGNILAGQCVVDVIEDIIRGNYNDMPAMLMESLQVAKEAGGDGRCSCSQGNPTRCGCPPTSFQKCGHVGFMISARQGDVDSPVCNANGCANGDYYLDLNVANQGSNAADPVDQLQELYDDWRKKNDLNSQ